ncbi:MAG: pyruvate, phosphate dikinase [Candidatus Cloacimonetes bacterium]|jgi:pyruvate,orthophosphate dikinase|nr:pyruvate, phosphate dikinase [Candidatus Cloacimonadota bacterium]MDY0298868.1 pyruvate, phosphate dikinase [Candidatus Cloacimonadaceae bacterium]MCB5277927.1 pyruvate, phosphate dikinase [Candidatus Cloacimonadota bacterium]MCK9331664.1 pyruvate, phosphate dikinase [Candidatus Cloacimonadota bacterium]MDD2210370.1 pyruvate, phosphate dikinase [Candidatus Cloacimonadota bacterium]
MTATKRVYLFGNGHAEGKADMKNLLGGKGANLAEMNLIGVPVPPGFTITTDACTEYNQAGPHKLRELLTDEVKAAVKHVEQIMNMQFGSNENPLLVSVRSGARASMPGMMDTILNLGMNDNAVQGIIKKTNNERFAWDSYRRFVQMYGDVVLGLKPQSKEEEDPFEVIIHHMKEEKGVKNDLELTSEDLKQLVALFKKAVKDNTGHDFPDDPWEQLWGAIFAVFDSWNNDRAMYYRQLNSIPHEWGTAVNVQAMVFGNMGNSSATGVAFTRDAATGENIFNGEYLINAQGEDVVAGIRTPQQITKEGSMRWAKLAGISEEERAANYPSLEEVMPQTYQELFDIQHKLEHHAHDMQDLEFTIQDGKLWMLQTRNGKRTGFAMVKIAVDMLNEGMIDEKTALLRMEPEKLDELLHPVFNKDALTKAHVIAKGLPASPGAATGQIVFFADDAEAWAKDGKKVILVRTETSPEDLRGMNVAKGILTARGGMTSHAAVVARGMGKCCVSGAGTLMINYKTRIMTVDGKSYKEGEWISLNGSTGQVLEGKVDTQDPELSGDFAKIMELADKYTKMKVRTNADTPKDATVARNFGAEGIGLCRTEHMFFEGDRIKAMREMILADDEAGRIKALDKLLPMQRSDFEGIFSAMDGFPVTVRLLDPPLHEFVPHEEKDQIEIAKDLGIDPQKVKDRVNSLHEFNPMLGHRGCRLGNTYPEITEMQARAIIEAAINVQKKGVKVFPEIMVPLIGTLAEFKLQEEIIRSTAEKVFQEKGQKVEYMVGTMIEIPRAALTADKIAESAEFFSFGTNDLTQMTFGYSRDDAGVFLPVYLRKNLLKHDPFQVLDQEGVGQLVEMGTKRGRSTRPNLKVGICGEHGGEPSSVEFCHSVGMNYVSCSPYRVPIARLAAAMAAIR